MARKRTGQDRPRKGSPDQRKSRTRNPILARRRGARNVSERSKATHANRLGRGVWSVSSARGAESFTALCRPTGNREQGFKQGRRTDNNNGFENASLKRHEERL